MGIIRSVWVTWQAWNYISRAHGPPIEWGCMDANVERSLHVQQGNHL